MQPREEISFSEFSAIVQEFAAYKQGIQGCSVQTVQEYLMDLRTFFRYLLSKEQDVDPNSEDFKKIDVSTVDLERIRRITTTDIYDFLLFVGTNRGNQWSAKSRKLSSLKAFYRFLVSKRHYLAESPVANIESPKPKKTLPKVLTLDEALTLLRTAENDTASPHRVRDYAMLTLFLNCGMRVAELTGINLTDLDPELRSLRVLGKGNKERVVYLNDACRSALTPLLAERLAPRETPLPTKALFLSNRESRISIKTVQHVVYKYLAMAGLDAKHYSVHKLRHTAATLMYQSGKVDVRVLKDILGHEQLNTTQIYTHISDAQMESAMSANPLSSLAKHKKESSPAVWNGADWEDFPEEDTDTKKGV